MDFGLAEEDRMIRETIREFCEEEVRPIAQTIENERRFPAEVFERLGELGALGLSVGEASGGLGAGQLPYALVCEEIGRASGAVGLSYSAHLSLAAKPLDRYGTEAQKRRFLRPLATGEAVGAWALTEPESGSDAGAMRTRAEPVDDGWVLDGSKRFITNGSVADVILVKAVTDPDARTDGISTFVVTPDDEGFEVTHEWEKLGLNASPTCDLSFDGVRLGPDRLLGEAGDGWAQTLRTLDGGRIGIAALSVGLARGASEAAREYALEREQFDRPIASFDAVRDMLVGMYRRTERARLLTHRAAWKHDRGDDVTLASALAKLDASEAAREVAEDAVQVLGGAGYVEDFPVQRYYRDAKLMEIGEGTSEIQRLVIGRELGL